MLESDGQSVAQYLTTADQKRQTSECGAISDNSRPQKADIRGWMELYLTIADQKRQTVQTHPVPAILQLFRQLRIVDILKLRQQRCRHLVFRHSSASLSSRHRPHAHHAQGRCLFQDAQVLFTTIWTARVVMGSQ